MDFVSESRARPRPLHLPRRRDISYAPLASLRYARVCTLSLDYSFFPAGFIDCSARADNATAKVEAILCPGEANLPDVTMKSVAALFPYMLAHREFSLFNSR